MKNQCKIEHQHIVEKALKLLQQAQSPEILSQVEQFADAVKQRFLDNEKVENKWTFFVPTFQEDKEQIESFDYAEAYKKEILSYKHSLKVCDSDISSQKEELFNGKRKMELVNGWLSRISDSVVQFLSQQFVTFSILFFISLTY